MMCGLNTAPPASFWNDSKTGFVRFAPVELSPWMCGLIADPNKLFKAVFGMLPLEMIPGGGLIKMILKRFIV